MDNSISRFIKLSFGNIIEWYDFSLYVYFSSYIAHDFFPHDQAFWGLFFTLLTFAIGSLIRPVGGIIMGILTNKYGLRYAVNLCIITMGFSTCSMAILPTYHAWGIFAPIALTLVRILQGLSVGGQFPGLLSLSVKENQDLKGFSSALMYSISSFGFLLASLTAFIITKWGNFSYSLTWRIPFALSAFLFIIYIIINRNEDHSADMPPQPKHGILEAFSKQYKEIITVIILTVTSGALYYIVFTYLVRYQILHLHISRPIAFMINTGMIFLACLLYPLFGILADKHVHPRKLFHTSSFILLAAAIPLFYIMNSKGTIYIPLALTVFAFLVTAIQGASTPWYSELFDRQWRTACCGLSFNIGLGIGGTFPAIALLITQQFPKYGLAVLIMILVFFGMVGGYMVARKKRKKKQLQTIS